MDRGPHRRTAVILALLLAIPAHAQKKPAMEIFRKGVDAFRAGDYQKAEKLFLSSYELYPRAATLCNLGLTYEKWGDHVEQAIEMYESCAAKDQTGKYRLTAMDRAQKLREAEERKKPDADADVVPDPEPPPASASAPAPDPAPPPPLPAPPSASASDPPPHSPPRYWRWSAIATGAAAGAVGAAGVLYVHRSNDSLADLDRRFPDGNVPAGGDDEAQLHRAARDATTGKRLYLGAGILAAVSVTCVILDLTLEVRPAPGGGTLSFVTRY